MADKKNIGLAVALGIGALIVFSGDFDTGTPIDPVDCEGIEASSRQITCFEVPTNGANIALAVIHEGEALSRRPVLFLPPLPGETPIADADLYADHPLAEDHDIVLVDPRGAGRSTPTLHCPDLNANPSSLDLLQRCREDLIDDRSDLITIGTDTTVDDLEAVRQALRQGRSWRKWHVIGTGYGSQLGHRLAQAYPGGIESLTLASVIPPDRPSITARAASFAPALDAVTAWCEQDRGCARLGSTTAAANRIAGRLRTSPEPLEIPRLDGAGRGDVIAFDDSLARITFWRALRQPQLAILLPWATDRIDSAASEFGMTLPGRETLAAMRAATSREEAVSQPVFWTLVCSEQTPSIDQGLLADLVAATPELIAPIAPAEACPVWMVPQAIPPRLENPVRADTLILASQSDPGSTRAWADEMSTLIDGSVVIEVTGLSRLPGGEGCEAAALAAFIDSPGQVTGVPCQQRSPTFWVRPVPIAGASFRTVADVAGPMSALVLGTLIATGMAVWTVAGPPGAARVAWAAAAGGTLSFLLMAGLVLATANEPGRLVAQPPLTWPIFLLPWATALAGLTACVLTAKAMFDGRLRSPWPARHVILAIGVALAWVGAALSGMIPGT